MRGWRLLLVPFHHRIRNNLRPLRGGRWAFRAVWGLCSCRHYWVSYDFWNTRRHNRRNSQMAERKEDREDSCTKISTTNSYQLSEILYSVRKRSSNEFNILRPLRDKTLIVASNLFLVRESVTSTQKRHQVLGTKGTLGLCRGRTALEH